MASILHLFGPIFFNVACLELPSVASGIMHAHVHANSYLERGNLLKMDDTV